jgi:hypothetical protein
MTRTEARNLQGYCREVPYVTLIEEPECRPEI